MELILFGLLAVLLVFMIFNTRKRSKQMKAEQEAKAANTVPGVKVLLQGGLYGTIVSYNADDLDSPALVEIAPGTVIEVHSQAILRIVEPKEDVVDLDAADDSADLLQDDAPHAPIETAEETRARLDRDSDNK
jgi:preprotein translocase subunit YajC